MKIFLIILFLLFISHIESYAQDCQKFRATPKCDMGWFSLAIGTESEFDFTGTISFNLGREHFWKFSSSGKANLWGNSSVSSVEIMRGISMVDRIGRFSVAAGPSILVLENYGTNKGRKATIGISAVTELFATPFKEFGPGIDIMATLSPNYRSIGIRFVIAIEGHK